MPLELPLLIALWPALQNPVIAFIQIALDSQTDLHRTTDDTTAPHGAQGRTTRSDSNTRPC